MRTTVCAYLLTLAVACMGIAQEAATPAAQPRPPLPAIPGAHGFGMETPAGSGRHLDAPQTRVVKATNLNPAGPGSLREALEAEGPRTVVFEVSGNIDFTPYGSLSVRNPYITIAGQTAPSPGITLKGCELNIGTHDVLMQHIRIRVGDLRDPRRPEVDPRSGWSQWSERDCMKVGGERIVINHCSFSWATDENAQSRGSDLTFRHNIFSEGLNSPKHHKGGHSKALILLKQGKGEGQNIAVIGNLFAHNGDRTPEASAGVTMAVINNLMYGASVRPQVGVTLANAPPRGDTHGGGACATVVGNHFDETPRAIRFIARRDVVGRVFLGELFDYTDKEGKYVEEHITDPWTAPHMLIFKEWVGEKVYPDESKVEEPPVAVPGLVVKASSEVRDWVLAHAGARPADRDPVDERIVREVRERTGKIPESQEDVGGWPELAQNRRELALPQDPNGDADGDGYTNLEEWLHAFAAEVEGRVQ